MSNDIYAGTTIGIVAIVSNVVFSVVGQAKAYQTFVNDIIGL